VFRIWGEQGQTALEKASICLLNCGPTGSETLKNLVLGGVGSITVIDGSKVELGDLGNNFMGILSFSLFLSFLSCFALLSLICDGGW
jgi:tRNA A37 threonylcarbamoyladenosine dehydratase